MSHTAQTDMTREQRVTEVFVEVADSLIADFDLIDFLQQLSVRCMELLDVAAVGILPADVHGSLQTIAASDEHTRLPELFALQNNQGPCVDCYRNGTARTNIDLSDPRAGTGWPQFAARARETGFVATIAILLQRTAAHGEVERTQFQYALTSRIVLEQVKGILAERWQVSVDEAFGAFRSYARAHSLQPARLARGIAGGTFDTTLITRPTTSAAQH